MRTRKDDLSGAAVRRWPARMRVVSQREFFRTPALVNSLQPGEALAVLKHREPSFLALKPRPGPQHSTQELIQLAQAVRGKRRSFDGVSVLKNLR
jgi:hypothetical protein